MMKSDTLNTKDISALMSKKHLASLCVMASDRHKIATLARQIFEQKTAKGQPLGQTELVALKAKLETLIAHSCAVYAKREDSVPLQLFEKLNHDLPVTAEAQTLIDAIRTHQVVIIAGETGSGKTTQLPKLAMLAGRGRAGQIGHTQPRRLAARSVATRIAEELGESLGQTVSFKVRFTEEGGSHSLVKLMTDGILLAELGSDKFLSRYDTIIIDEAHERSLNIDFIMGYLKRLLPKRPDLKVIITSATLDTERFSEYFSLNGKTAPVYVVEGRSYPVEVRYRPLIDEVVTSSDDDSFDEFEDKLPRALVAAVEECVADARQKGLGVGGDILVFATTESEIRELADTLTQHGPPHTEVLTLFARQSFSEQARIFSPSSKGRRIIISTNVAETALTVPNIRYVIDLGFARISRYNYRSRVQRLPIEAISQAAANQRAGRCGRVAEGVCIRLYSEEDFNARPAFTEPEILRTNLASVVLQMASLGLGEVADFDFITPPDFRLINDAKKLLHELSALSDAPTKTAQKKRQHTAATLTPIGKQMAKMPIDPRLARMLIAGADFDCLADMLIIVSALSVQDIKERPAEKQAQADQKHALFRAENSDFLFYLNVFSVLFGKHELNDFTPLTGNARKNFAKKHFLSFPRIKEWQKTHSQLSQMMVALGYDIQKVPSVFEEIETPEKPERLSLKNLKTDLKNQKTTPASTLPKEVLHYANLHRALLTALLSFVAKKTETKGEYLMAKNQKTRIFPASTLHKKGVEWLLAFEVVETSQVYMRITAKIEPEWILAAAGDLLKYHYFEPHWSKKTGRVRAYAQISLFGLVVVAKELVNYEKINPVESREIFIRDALVANEYGVEVDFLTYNAKKLSEALLAENKLRRRDLLADEETLYQFYEKKLPEHIASRKALQDFLGEKKGGEFLYFKDEDIYQDFVAVGREFPEMWQMGALRLPLSYVFDPSSDDDGVQVKVPKDALSQLDPVALLWGIAGWRFELVAGLLKTLPKDIRRQIVPIPDTAQNIFPALDEKSPMGLLDQLCAALGRLGVKASASDFSVQSIERYLQPLICVLDEKGRVIDKDRDLQKLKLKYPSHQKITATEETGRHSEFPEHFDFIRKKHMAGVAVAAFSALTPDKTGKAVNIADYTDLGQTLSVHKRGVLALIKAKLGSRQKQLTGQIDKAFKMAFAPLGDLEKLKELVVDATLELAFDGHAPIFNDPRVSEKYSLDNKKQNRERDELFTQNLLKDDKHKTLLLEKLPLSLAEYRQTEAVILEVFLSVGQAVLKTLKDIYTAWQTVRGQLLMLDGDTFGENISDIEDQLDDLSLSDFIYRTPSHIWKEYPRYLSALKVRLEKLPNNLEQDLDAVYLLDVHMERLANVRHDPKFSEYRWLVEEYRINLFAQPMKTLVPVSEKRLEKLWASLTTK